jgi:uncharacterized protein (TIGR03086 family)
VVAHSLRAGDFEPFDESCKFACEGVLVVAADHDLDPAVGRGTANFEAAPEHHPEQPEPVGSAHGLGFERRALSVDLVGDLAPALGKVESLGSSDGIVGQLDRRDTIDSEGPSTGLGIGDQVPRRALGDGAEWVDGPLGLGAVAVDISEPHLDAADHRVLDVVEKPGWSGLGLARSPERRVDDDGRRGGLGLLPEGLGQRTYELAQRSLDSRGRGGGRSGDQEQGAGFARGQPGEVGASAAQEAPPSPTSLYGVHGHPGHGQRVEVAAGGSLGDFQLLRDLGCRDLLALLQQQEDGNQSVSSHAITLPQQTGHWVTGLGRHDGAMTTPTSSTTDHLTDPRPIFDRAVATGLAVIAGVRHDQLTDPTPCTDMNVRAMLTHLVGVLDRVAALGNGEDPFGVAETPVADDRWADAWKEAGTRAADAWRDDTVLERPMALPWIQGSGAEVLASYFSELTVHTWDLAMATGQQPVWDDTVVTAALEARQILPAENRRALFEEISTAMGLDEVAVPFAEAVPVPDDAAGIDRLVAWNGRDPLC